MTERRYHDNTKLLTDAANPQADRDAVRLLRKVDKLRAELRVLEPELSKAITAYGRRHGYMLGYREFHFRNDIDNIKRKVA